jgi:hypothetical protein
MNPIDRRSLIGPTLSLFASTSTLVCCALPALLITIGAGAVMAGLTAAVPGIMWLSANKGPLFIASGVLLSASAFMQWRARNAPCPADPEQAAACNALRALSRRILIGSYSLYATGVFFAYLWPVIYL